MSGGLFDPLGTDRPEPGGGASRPSVPVVLAGLALVALAALLAVSYLRDDGDRGRPVAVAPIEHVEVAPPPPAPASVPVPLPTAAPPPPPVVPAVHDDQEVEIQNGVRVIRPRRGGSGGGGQTIQVPDPKAGR